MYPSSRLKKSLEQVGLAIACHPPLPALSTAPAWTDTHLEQFSGVYMWSFTGKSSRNHGIIGSTRLEKTSKIIKANYYPRTAKTMR